MNKFGKKIISVTLIFLVLGFVLYLILLFVSERNPDPNAIYENETISYETGENLFDAEKVLSEIQNGDTNIFYQTKRDTALDFPDNYINSVHFTDDELFEIVQYYLRIHWNEDPDDWRLVKVVYSLYDCEKGLDGPYRVGYFFEKQVTINRKKYVNERKIGIISWKDMINWYDKVEERDNLSPEINRGEINIQAVDVYNIAEDNGGGEMHSDLDSKCEVIVMRLFDNDVWNIRYESQSDEILLELVVDPKTGEVNN